MDTKKKHRSHISSKQVKSRGWSAKVPYSITNLIEGGNRDFVNENFVSYTDCSSSTGVNDVSWHNLYPSTTTTWGTTWLQDFDGTRDEDITELKKEIKRLKEVRQVRERTLFRVYVVNPKGNGAILMDGKVVVAENENQALLKAGVAQVATEAGLELEQVDVYAEEIGTFIRPRKETQKVKISKDDDD